MDAARYSARPPPRPPLGRSSGRRGVAILLVLGLLAMTLALCYASLRSQASATLVAQNADRAQAARLAAESGIYTALRQMSDGTWGGIDSTLVNDVTGDSWYEVSFRTGDDALSPADAAYGEFPYRVTITSAGHSSDAAQPAVRASHEVRAVVQLARRSLNPVPANWSNFEPLTLHQWGNRTVRVQFPVRIDGTAHLLGRLELADQYPSSAIHLQRYLSDLNARRLAGLPDDRPFGGPLAIVLARQSPETLLLLTTHLGLPVFNSTASSTPPVPHPGSVPGYRLYPGGKLYMPPLVQAAYGSSLQNIVLEPNLETNPLGVFRSNSTLAIHDSVQIRGTLLGEGSSSGVELHGTNVSIAGVNLPPVEGNAQVAQLPAAIVRDDLRVLAGSRASIGGLAIVYDEFEIRGGSVAEQFSLRGQLFTSGLTVRGRTQYDALSDVQWDSLYNSFLAQTGVPFFPDWLEQQAALPVAPKLAISRDTSGVKYHWHNWSQPLFAKDPSDPGLRWNLVRWDEE